MRRSVCFKINNSIGWVSLKMLLDIYLTICNSIVIIFVIFFLTFIVQNQIWDQYPLTLHCYLKRSSRLPGLLAPESEPVKLPGFHSPESKPEELSGSL